MTNKEADSIIANYNPQKGFFDLSKKPENLKKLEYAKILEAQNTLVYQNTHRNYLKKDNPVQWEKLKEFSADLQQIVFKHWGNSVLE